MVHSRRAGEVWAGRKEDRGRGAPDEVHGLGEEAHHDEEHGEMNVLQRVHQVVPVVEDLIGQVLRAWGRRVRAPAECGARGA